MYYGIKEIMLTIGNCPKGCVTCTTEGCFPGCLINYKYDSTNYACICDTAVAILTSSGDCIDKCKATERGIENASEWKWSRGDSDDV